MLVDVVERLPSHAAAGTPVGADFGIDRSLRSFMAAIESDDSLFQCDGIHPAVTGDSLCCGDFILRFRRKELESNRSLHLAMLQKMIELLRSAGSAETLASRICLTRNDIGMELQVRLEAQGASGDQARLRWGLGLVHLQQALLFTSRSLRQQITQDT
jgi:hypothetical protein